MSALCPTPSREECRAVANVYQSAIHSYFVLREITFGWLGFGEKTCPNCHCNISHNRRAPRGYRQAPGEYEDAQDSDDSKETFHPAQMTKDQQQPKASSSKEPRPSTDDETARLV